MNTTNIRFLLIQGEIIDVSVRPDTLNFAFVDAYSTFQVAIGCVNEFGKAEIVGIVARVDPMPSCTRWCVSSELDGYNRGIGIMGRMADFVKERLRVYWGKGRFSDLCQLPQPILIRGEK